MSSFTKVLEFQYVSKGNMRVIRAFDYYLGKPHLKLCVITVPRGFITDGASIPRLLRFIASPYSGDHVKAAVLHDYLCRTNIINRRLADAIFYDAMIASGVKKHLAIIMHVGVRIGAYYLKIRSLFDFSKYNN